MPVHSTDAKPLNHRLTNLLLAYAAVAGAGIAASASHAGAEVIYTPTRNDIHGHFPIDLNHDGLNDFHIDSYYLSLTGYLEVIPVIPINKIAKSHGQGCFLGSSAAALPQGAVIGPGRSFNARATCMAVYNSLWYGAWVGQTDRYLGLEFSIDGQIHYGWARLTMNSFFCPGCVGRIFGYAYETIPGKPIIAGDQGKTPKAPAPATLGALALGTSTLDSWRIEREKK